MDFKTLRPTDQLLIAYSKVDYDHFEKLENSIANSQFTFDDYYRAMSNLNRKFEWLSIRY